MAPLLMRAHRLVSLLVFFAIVHTRDATAQGGAATPGAAAAPSGVTGPMRDAARLDLEGKTGDARAIIQRVIDTSTVPAAKAAAQRAMAMSFAFDGDCASTLKYEQLVIDYWRTRESAEPQNAFFQQGEMANEGARVCIDAATGAPDLDLAEKWYREGYALGSREPAPRTHAASLWDFRLAHALARLAARRGNVAEAQQQITAARRALDSDSAMAAQQERFFPYLVGYVALYSNDLPVAARELERALAMRGNERDPFVTALLAMTREKQGRGDEATALYRKAYELATGHNPPSAYVRRVVRAKLGPTREASR